MGGFRRGFSWHTLVSWPGLVTLAVVVIAAASAGAWMALRPAASAASYRLVPVITTSLSQSVTLTGMIKPAATATLSFSAPGTVTAVDVRAGQRVSAGQVLAVMTSATLQQQADQADATYAQDQATLAQDETGGASAAQLTADKATEAADKSQVGSARQALAGTTLRAPAAGLATTVSYTVGEQVNGGDSGGGDSGSTSGSSPGGSPPGGNGSGGSSSASPSITVVSLSDVVNATVNASGVNKIKAGDQAIITEKGGTAPVTGTVASVSLVASTTNGVAVYPVVIDITGTPAGLFSGASASVSVASQHVSGVLAVPAGALRAGPGGRATVRVLSGGRLVTRTVATGITANGLTQVSGALAAGDKVAVPVRAPGPATTPAGGPRVIPAPFAPPLPGG